MTTPFETLAGKVLDEISRGHCVSLYGLSNTGKSTIMRWLASPEAKKLYAKKKGHEGELVYVDCNRAVAISAQAFYEIVLRSILEIELEQRLLENLSERYRAVTEADNSFAASLSFNLALTELCENLGKDMALLIDEFDELYIALEDRALLNLRALRDRFKGTLTFVTATVRNLPYLRGRPIEGEFAEMFSRSSFLMPPLGEDEAHALLKGLALRNLDKDKQQMCRELAGGHPGLLTALAQVMNGLDGDWNDHVEQTVIHAPQSLAECLKVWTQLSEEEQHELTTLVTEPGASLPQPRIKRLERLGLVQEGVPFAPVFSDFISRWGRSPEIGATGIHVDTDSGDVWVGGVRIPVLTDLEYRLLKLLYERLDKITDKYGIVEGVWGETYLGEVDDARVEKLVSRLRGKIEPDPTDPIYLITQRGRGYKLLTRPRGG